MLDIVVILCERFPSSAYLEKRLLVLVKRRLFVISMKRISLSTHPSGLPAFVVIGSDRVVFSLVI